MGAADPALALLGRFVGEWRTEATHPMMPGQKVYGTASVEWLAGGRFLIVRAAVDHPDFPDSVSVVGYVDQDREAEGGEGARPTCLRWHWYDSRGVFRSLELTTDASSFSLLREAPGFSQRATNTFSDGDRVIEGRWQLRRDDVHWEDDLAITYRRA